MFGLTTPQKSVLLTEQYYRNTNINNVSGYLHISEKDVDTSKLELGINNFIKENEQVRARIFQDEDYQLKQYYKKYRKEKIQVVKLQDLEAKEEYEKSFCNRRFNLIEKKLYRFCIYKLENGEAGVIFSANHLICDAWSMTILIDTIVNTYTNNNPKKKVDYQYKNYVADEEEYYKSDKYKQDEEYWRTLFSKNIETTSKYMQEDISAKRIETQIDKALLDKLLTLDRSFFNLYISALSIYFSKLNSLNTVIFGTPLLNRKNFIEKQVVGMFVNTLPLMIDIDRKISFKDFLNNNKQKEMQLFRHQKMPYERIMKIAKESNPQINNLFDITVSYQNARDNHKNASVNYNTGWVFDGCISDSLDVHIYDLDDTGTLKIFYDYQTNKYDESEVLKIHERILNIMEQVCLDENILVRDISIITNQELEELEDINNITARVPQKSSVIHMFKKQVKKTPKKIAISFEGEEITYEDLDEQSDRVAEVLIKKGIKKSNIVSIFIPKSLEFFTYMLGILKAGATYLPLDVEFPDNRVNYILNDSKSKLCLTDEVGKKRISIPIKTLTIDEINKEEIKDENIVDKIEIEPKDNCYIIYTSGTTRRAKRCCCYSSKCN